ncbi:hypothetical protein [Streptomyces abikoensis]
MSATEAPATEEVTHAAALTEADADALAAFLIARTEAVLGAHPAGSDEYRVALALDDEVRELVKPVRASFRYDDGSHELLEARRRHWNRLHQVADRWEDADGYDRARWRRVDYTDAADEQEAADYRRKREEEHAAWQRQKLLRSL